MTLSASLTAADERRAGRGHIGVYQIVLVGFGMGMGMGMGIIVSRTQPQETILWKYMMCKVFVAAGVGHIGVAVGARVGVGVGIVALLLVLVLQHLLSQREKQRCSAELFFKVISRLACESALADQLHVTRCLLGEGGCKWLHGECWNLSVIGG